MKIILISIVFFINILAQETIKKAEMEILLSIGNNENLGLDYLFADPVYLMVDTIGNIFIADKMNMQIRKFDKNGKFISRMGTRGRGPGEYLDFSYIGNCNKKELAIFDMYNARITFLNLEGDYLKSNKIDFNKLLWPKALIYLHNSYLIHSKLEYRNETFHLFDSTFSNTLQSFGAELFPNNQVENTEKGFFEPSILKTSDSVFLYVRPFYDGIIRKYCLVDKKWKYCSEFSTGRIYEREAYEILSNEIKDRDKYSIRAYSKGSKTTFILNNESRGIFKLTTGEIIHFTLLKNMNRRVFGFEIFSENMELIDYCEIFSEKIPRGKALDIPIKVVEIDKDNNFYLIRKIDDIPVIQKVKFKY